LNVQGRLWEVVIVFVHRVGVEGRVGNDDTTAPVRATTAKLVIALG
jgi:hypothetical protein